MLHSIRVNIVTALVDALLRFLSSGPSLLPLSRVDAVFRIFDKSLTFPSPSYSLTLITQT